MSSPGGPIRCAFVNHYSGYGGAEFMLLRLLERLDRSRVVPIVFAATDGLLVEEARALGVDTRVVPVSPALLEVARGGSGSRGGALAAAAALPVASLRLAREIARARTDVVVTNSAKAHVYGSLAGWLARRPVVWRIHDTMDSADFAGSTRKLLLEIGRRVPRRVLAVSDACGLPLIQGGIPAERVTTLYNGIDLAVLRADASRLGVSTSNGMATIGSIGRLTPMKGHEVVIDAAARLLHQGVQARFIIAGAPAREAPEHLAALRERVERLGIADRVELISPFDDLATVLSALDVLVHASVLPDSLPTTVIESMALGKPVVATYLGGVPELVRDNETGFLIPPNDPIRMAEVVAGLIAAPETRASVGRAAFEEASARFDIDVFADAFARHLEEVAATT